MGQQNKGFASMDRSRQREIASKGGVAAHQKGTAHEWSPLEAREAGRKGGLASAAKKRSGQAMASQVVSSDVDVTIAAGGA